MDCDPSRQYPDIQEQVTALLKTSSAKAQSTFTLPFTDDYGTPAKALLVTLTGVTAVWEDLEKEHKANGGKAGKEPDAARLKAFEQFLAPWSARLAALSAKPAGDEDILFPETRRAMGHLVGKIGRFQELYTCELKGVPCQTQVDHPNWFEPTPMDDLSRIRRLLAAEFAFNSARKVVLYGYDKADDLMKSCMATPPKPNAAAQWARFKADFSRDLAQSRLACEALAAEPQARDGHHRSDALPSWRRRSS